MAYLIGWGTRIRTLVGGVRVRSPTARRSPIGIDCKSLVIALGQGLTRACPGPRPPGGYAVQNRSRRFCRTLVGGVRVRSPTARRSPKFVPDYVGIALDRCELTSSSVSAEGLPARSASALFVGFSAISANVRPKTTQGPLTEIVKRLSFRVLCCATSLTQANFLTLDFTRIAGYESSLAQCRPK